MRALECTGGALDCVRDRRGDGAYARGSVFVFDLLQTDTAGGALSEGPRKVLGVMHKDADAFAGTGGWGFAGFGGDSRTNVVTDARAGCFECHAGRESTGFVFSTWRKSRLSVRERGPRLAPRPAPDRTALAARLS